MRMRGMVTVAALVFVVLTGGTPATAQGASPSWPARC